MVDTGDDDAEPVSRALSLPYPLPLPPPERAVGSGLVAHCPGAPVVTASAMETVSVWPKILGFRSFAAATTGLPCVAVVAAAASSGADEKNGTKTGFELIFRCSAPASNAARAFALVACHLRCSGVSVTSAGPSAVRNEN